MLRLSFCAGCVVLALAPLARADGGPAPSAMYGGDGIVSRHGGVRYVTLPANGDTALETVRMHDGRVLGFTVLHGSWGVPQVTWSGETGGLSSDGRTLVLADTSAPARSLFWKTSSFLVLDAKKMQPKQIIRLGGTFSFDAISPDGRMLYFIQYVSQANSQHYLVRGYDRPAHRLLAQPIADRTQRGWVMQGSPVTRATSSDGRWSYTLYSNYGGTPFVHALDTVGRKAHCIGIPWHGDQSGLWNIKLSVRDGSLTLDDRHGIRVLAIDTRTFRISYPRAEKKGGSLSLLWFVLAVPFAALLAGARFARRRLLASAPGWRTSVSSG